MLIKKTSQITFHFRHIFSSINRSSLKTSHGTKIPWLKNRKLEFVYMTITNSSNNLYIYLSIDQLIDRSIYLSINLYIYLSVHLYIFLCI